MKRIISLLFAVMLAMEICVSASAEIIEYDIKDTQGNKFDKAGYISDTEYRDESIHVVISYDRAYDTDYMIVRVSIANGTQIRTSLSSRDGKSVEAGVTLAKHANAVFAIDGDSFMTHEKGAGKHIVRQGRVVKHNAKGEFDVLVIDSDGNLDILLKATEEDFDNYEKEIVNAFSFGPALIYNGELMPIERDDSLATEKSAQRVALCQLAEPEEGYSLSYVCVISAGPENVQPNGKLYKGMDLHQFAEVVYNIGGITMAYNFDGGSGALAVFNGTKMNKFGIDKSRSISDIIYFATADTEAFR